MTSVVGVDGTVEGQVLPYTPPGGVIISAPSKADRVATADAAGGFNITLDFSGGGLSTSQQAVFAAAAARWESVLTGDLPDINGVDDVKIYASGQTIDGVGNILGQAGYTALRSGSYLPYMGSMAFDSADLTSMEANGQLTDVITHEMGHVLGIGSIWTRKGLMLGSAATGDSRFIGTNAVAEYQKFTGNLSATSLPIETDGGAGTADAHWDDATFGNELMTGYLSATNPLSRMTAASLIDLGYPLVNVDAADLYTVSNPLPTIGSLSASTSLLGSPVTLSVSAASDNGSVSAINFYRESNGIPGLQSTGTVTSDTLVGTATGGSLSVSVATTGLGLGSYTYYARAADNFGLLSASATATGTVVNASLPATPAAPDMLATSDTGDSNADNVTANSRPTFSGTVSPGTTVLLQADGTTVGSAIADLLGNYAVTPNAAIADGPHAFTVTSTTVLGTSASSPALATTIDTVGGRVVSVTYDRDVTQDLVVTFDDAAVAARAAAASATLRNGTRGSNVAFDRVSVSGATVRFIVDAALPDGSYAFTLPAANLKDLAGNALTSNASTSFLQLNGDVNADGTVDFADLLLLARNYGATTGRIASTGNVDYSADGAVSFNDLIVLAKNYGSTAAGLATTSGLSASTTSGFSASLIGITDGTGQAPATRRSLYRAIFA